ncbi:MAG: beta-lactamase family protein [Bacteroidetes bacterium]|nr:beta-lactamase family protein [Bacteroidota bacterium]
MSKSFVLKFLLIIIGLSQITGVKCYAQNNELYALVELVLENSQLKNETAGYSVALVKNGHIVYASGFGLANSNLQVLATDSTEYRIASISKTITATIAMRLWQKGKIDLEQSVHHLLPEYRLKEKGAITPHHLLCHQSGMLHYSGNEETDCYHPYSELELLKYSVSKKTNYNPISALSIFEQQPLCFEPGFGYNYTTWGYCLLGAYLQRTQHKTYNALIIDEVTAPLEMMNLRIALPVNSKSQLAALHKRVKDSVCQAIGKGPEFENISYKAAGGGITANVYDLGKFIIGLTSSNYLADSTFQLMATPKSTSQNKPTGYGYGLGVEYQLNDTIYSHTGS